MAGKPGLGDFTESVIWAYSLQLSTLIFVRLIDKKKKKKGIILRPPAQLLQGIPSLSPPAISAGSDWFFFNYSSGEELVSSNFDGQFH